MFRKPLERSRPHRLILCSHPHFPLRSIAGPCPECVKGALGWRWWLGAAAPACPTPAMRVLRSTDDSRADSLHSTAYYIASYTVLDPSMKPSGHFPRLLRDVYRRPLRQPLDIT